MIHRILLGYDGSVPAGHAHAFAVEMSRRYAAELHVVVVARPPDFGDEVEVAAVLEASQARYQAVLSTLQRQMDEDGIHARTVLVAGHPAEQLIRYAEAQSIDHIVVGHRGRSLFERWLIGSVARQVVAYARCGVTIVR